MGYDVCSKAETNGDSMSHQTTDGDSQEATAHRKSRFAVALRAREIVKMKHVRMRNAAGHMIMMNCRPIRPTVEWCLRSTRHDCHHLGGRICLCIYVESQCRAKRMIKMNGRMLASYIDGGNADELVFHCADLIDFSHITS